jgi:hypothetical protein
MKIHRLTVANALWLRSRDARGHFSVPTIFFDSMRRKCQSAR